MSDNDKLSQWIKVIFDVANDQQYGVESGGDLTHYVYIDRWNAVAYRLYLNRSSGYIEVSQWEGSSDEDACYGRPVYSLRSFTDVSHFCNILIASEMIRAKRRS